jgi:hypothetical protein
MTTITTEIPATINLCQVAEGDPVTLFPSLNCPAGTWIANYSGYQATGSTPVEAANNAIAGWVNRQAANLATAARDAVFDAIYNA